MVFILKQGPDVIEAIDAQPSACPLTLKPLGYFFSKCNSTFSIIHPEWNIVVWNHPSTMNILSTLWILMAWCFSTRASVATVLNTHPCVSRCLRVNYSEIRYNLSCLATNDPVDQFNIKTSSYQTEYGGSHYIKMRGSWDRLSFIMKIPILVKRHHLYIQAVPPWITLLWSGGIIQSGQWNPVALLRVTIKHLI